MRYLWLSGVVLLIVAAVALPQQAPPAGQPNDPNRVRLDEVLVSWEKSMAGVKSVLAFCTRTNVDKVYQTTEVFEGTVKLVKAPQPGQTWRASFEMIKKGRPEVYEKFIYTGSFLYEYAPQSKVIRVHELPPPKPGQVADDNLLALLFGMKAPDLKKRYQLTYVPPPANDKWYYYVKILPVETADKAEFTEARVVLMIKDSMPRQLWFQQPNGNETTWDITKVVNGADIRLTEFATPALPASDWRFVRVPRETPARVIRQNQ